MNIDFTKEFNKQFKKLSLKRQLQTKATLLLFLQNTSSTQLRNHALKGEWLGYRSISAGGDIRLHYKIINKDTVLFVSVGTHSQLYK